MYKVGIYLRVRKACFIEGMSVREAARVFGLHRDTVRKMLEYSVPPGYRRQRPARRPKLDPYKGVMDQTLLPLHNKVEVYSAQPTTNGAPSFRRPGGTRAWLGQ